MQINDFNGLVEESHKINGLRSEINNEPFNKAAL
jgi:hypothetical protein